jgi:putative transposase
MVSEAVGYDGGKRITGRKNHLLVDSLGLLLAAIVTTASLSEGAGLKQLLTAAAGRGVGLERLVTILVDGGYQGEALVRWVMDCWRWVLERVLRPVGRGFVLMPRRWVVERTFGWLRWCRRLNRDYEYLPRSRESWIYLASIRLMLRRLA